jgi:hypothetical protein
MADGNPQGTDLDTATAAFSAFLTGDDGTQEQDEQQEPIAALADDEPVADQAPDESDEESQSDEEQDPEQEEGEQTYSVKVDGQVLEVPLTELLQGYSRTTDYHRKTEQVATARKAVEAELNEVKQERAQYAELLKMFESQIKGGMQQEPDWQRLRNEDPIEYAASWAEWQQRERQIAAAQSERKRVEELDRAEQSQRMTSVIADQAKALIEAVPEWKDEKRAQTEKQAVAAYAQKLGFTADELAQTYDHRAVVALRKAWMYDQLVARKAELKPAPQSQPMRPGVATSNRVTSDYTKAKQRLAQTGKVSDAAAAFRHLI